MQTHTHRQKKTSNINRIYIYNLKLYNALQMHELTLDLLGSQRVGTVEEYPNQRVGTIEECF